MPLQLSRFQNRKNRTPIHRSFEKPAGWSIEWYDQSTQSVARIYRTEAQGSEGIVISSTKLTDEFQSVAASEVYASEDFKHLAKMLNASIHAPETSMNGDGVYLEYPLPPAAQIRVTAPSEVPVPGRKRIVFYAQLGADQLHNVKSRIHFKDVGIFALSNQYTASRMPSQSGQ